MKYKFKCSCGNETEINASMNEIKGLEVICNKCGKMMHQLWGTSVSIPEYMKADSDEDISWLNFNKRPTGKDKVYY